MNFVKRTACRLFALALLDQLLTIVLVARGNQFSLYFSYSYFEENYADSFLELWLFSLVRLCVYCGVAIALRYNMRDAISRLPLFTKVYSVLLCICVTYSLVKLLVYSELPYFEEPFRLAFVVAAVFWDFAMCVVAYLTFTRLSHLQSAYRKYMHSRRRVERRQRDSPTQSVNSEADERTRLLASNDLEVVFNGWQEPRDDESESSDSDSEAESGEAGKRSKRRNVLCLLQLMRGDLLLVAVATVFLMVASVGETVLPLFQAKVVNAVVIAREYQAFVAAIWSMLGVAAASTVFAGGRAWLMGLCMYRVQLRLRARLFAALMKHEIAFFDRTPTGDIVSRLTTDASTVGSLITINCNVFLRTSIKACKFHLP